MTQARDEAAISSVLGAILVFGLLVLTLVMVQTKYVPVWDRDREAQQMQDLGNELGQLRSDLDRLANNRSAAPVAETLTLAPDKGLSFFQGGRLASTLSFVPSAGSGLRVGTSQARVVSLDGEAVFAGSENWTQVATGDTRPNIGTVQNLRLRITDPANYDTGDSVTLSLTNATGAYAGKIVITNINRGVASGGPTYSYRFETYAASSSTVPASITEETFGKESPPAYQYFDLLRGELQFKQVLSASQGPSTLVLTRNNIDAFYTASYTLVSASGGSTVVGAAGTLVPNFARSFASGKLVVESGNQRFVDQAYIVEHGAVIREQPEGAAMFIPPAFGVSIVAGITDIRWVLPAMTGSAGSIAGPDSGTVLISPGTPSSFVASMPHLDVQILTAHGSVWTQYWTAALQGVGLAYGTQFTVSSNTTSAQLVIYGQQATPSSTVDDVFVTFTGSTLAVAPRAGA
jgi:hypothetical protein